MAGVPPLPPGFVFQPDAKILINFYLRRKINRQPLPRYYPRITDVNIYDHHPSEVFERSRGGTTRVKDDDYDRYFFTPVNKVSKTDSRFKRTVGNGLGTWSEESDKPVTMKGSNKIVIGSHSYFTYKPKKRCSRDEGGVKWTMHEYLLSGNHRLALCKITKKVTAVGNKQPPPGADLPSKKRPRMMISNDDQVTSPLDNGGGVGDYNGNFPQLVQQQQQQQPIVISSSTTHDDHQCSSTITSDVMMMINPEFTPQEEEELVSKSSNIKASVYYSELLNSLWGATDHDDEPLPLPALPPQVGQEHQMVSTPNELSNAEKLGSWTEGEMDEILDLLSKKNDSISSDDFADDFTPQGQEEEILSTHNDDDLGQLLPWPSCVEPPTITGMIMCSNNVEKAVSWNKADMDELLKMADDDVSGEPATLTGMIMSSNNIEKAVSWSKADMDEFLKKMVDDDDISGEPATITGMIMSSNNIQKAVSWSKADMDEFLKKMADDDDISGFDISGDDILNMISFD